MAAPTEQEWIDDTLQKYGPITDASYPSELELTKWQERLPDRLLQFWREYGWGAFSEGQFWTCNPEQLHAVIEEVFTGDPEFHPSDLIPIGYNALGMIVVYLGDGRTMTVDLPFGTVIWRDQSINSATGKPNSEFMVIFRKIRSGAHRLDWTDEDGTQIFPWALKNLGPLARGEIYGFVPAYSMAQRYPVENLQKLPIVEHLVFLASLQKPTLYDYEKPETGEGGFGTLVPKRLVGPQE
ncbi:GAD-like domain-containing protein [Marivita sp. S0852]|uniref:GAD-like domain-containing protein n=1 Tax=Marivita sp. S0852 TaxID=3373893 RepID=UPI003982334B